MDVRDARRTAIAALRHSAGTREGARIRLRVVYQIYDVKSQRFRSVRGASQLLTLYSPDDFLTTIRRYRALKEAE